MTVDRPRARAEPLTSEIMQEFLTDKKAKNLSGETLATYQKHFDGFLRSIGNIRVSKFDKTVYNQFVAALQGDDRKNDITTASYCRSIRAFLYWCMENDYIKPFKVHLPKYQKAIKRCYTDDELKRLLKPPTSDCSEVEYLSWVFVNLAAGTGLRLASMLNLRVSDIQDSTVYIDKTKNKRGMRVYINVDLQRILRRYIRLFDLSENDYLFTNGEGVRYARNTLQQHIRRFNKSRGVSKTSIHLFRHTFARNYYLNTHDVYSLCRLLGHSGIAVTEGYLSELGADVVITENAYNPQRQFAAQSKRRKGSIKR